jgi:hypothetical protein
MSDLTIFIGNTLLPLMAGIAGVCVGAVLMLSVLALAARFLERG